MKYTKFRIQNYRAIKDLTIDLSKRTIPLVGVNECGKTTILQAIESFDSVNDNFNGGKHLERVRNLYITAGSPPLPRITATIRMTEKDVVSLVNETTPDEQVRTILIAKIKPHREQFPLTRILGANTTATSKHSFHSSIFDELSEEEQTILSPDLPKLYDEIINNCPYVLYNDDFNDRPPKSITIGKTATDKDWECILERVFKSHPDKHDIFTFFEHDKEIKKSILSDINTYLSNILTKEWSRYTPDKDQKIEIVIEESSEQDKTFDISVKEKTKGGNRFFSIEDRSKGFIWNYNFIMKTLFSPKESPSQGNTIFLLDEPGSYLHSSAQTTLCKKIKEISEKEGIVIYCTHTPQLLDPKYIPINNIHIVEKDITKGISATQFSEIKTGRTKRTHMQPVYDALQIPEYTSVDSSTPTICVEGINDKYCLEIFGDLPNNMRILPGTNADSIITSIQYMIAFKIPYIALWDNDGEGRKSKQTATKHFGLIESERFLLLPEKQSGKRRMEEMIEQQDYEDLRTKLKLDPNSSYEKILYSIISLSQKERASIIKDISSTTKHNFLNLKTSITGILALPSIP